MKKIMLLVFLLISLVLILNSIGCSAKKKNNMCTLTCDTLLESELTSIRIGISQGSIPASEEGERIKNAKNEHEKCIARCSN